MPARFAPRRKQGNGLEEVGLARAIVAGEDHEAGPARDQGFPVVAKIGEREAAEILISSLAIFTDADRLEALRGSDNGLAGGQRTRGSAGRSDGMDDILIEELELGVRSYNCLKRAGVQTVGDLLQKSESELNAIPNFGRKSIEEVIETLKARGLDLRAA